MNAMTRRNFLATAAAPLALGQPRRTNVVFFMTDDHSSWALGAYGCPDIHTPNIDRLAAGGARFTRAFACTPVCSPSRLTYMTGRIPSHHGVQDWLRPVDSFGAQSRRWLDPHPTFSEILAQSGYKLGMSGKWHMGDDEHAQAGFTWWHTVPGGGGAYKDPEFVTNGKRAKRAGYKTDLVGDGALEFLDTVGADPFFLYVPFYAPHTPYNFQPEPYRKPYENARFSCFPRDELHPWINPGVKRHHLNEDSMRAYSALVTGVDHNVGRVLSRLDELGLRDDTLVIFTSDQGWNAGHHGVWGKGNGTVPFNMYEESIQTPLIWNHPGRIDAGQTPSPMVSSYDFFPTILDHLGVDAPADPKRAGRSYAPFLRGEQPAWRSRLFFEYSYTRAIRTENLKYVQRTREWPSELYDLEADPGETRNLIDNPAYTEQLARLRAELTGYFESAGSPPIEQWRSTTEQELTVYRRATPTEP
ncbi:MAG: sulfatase-like hydrolase/transferase [bacterium]|nr:sulfatase-like hydrolase/transferase [bacterium]